MACLSAYEEMRLNNIKENHAILVDLGLEHPDPDTPKPKRVVKEKQTKRMDPVRASSRLISANAIDLLNETDVLDALDALESADLPLPLPPPVLTRVSRPVAKPVAKQVAKPLSDDAKAVIEEFRSLLSSDGYNVNYHNDSTASKNIRYMRMLFDGDIFQTRADFFAPGARQKAHDFYMKMAEKNYNGKTSVRKLYTNSCGGFDKYAVLASFGSSDTSSTARGGDVAVVIDAAEQSTDAELSTTDDILKMLDDMLDYGQTEDA